ncbi:MAG: LuxR C-terminal-related transcriptional regulator [Anaerolineae bacterium]
MAVLETDILQTKLSPPFVRSDLVLRPRLTERFSINQNTRITLVCAPAGYGKSTVVAEYLATEALRDVRVAWLSLDEDDNDPKRFLTYLVASLTRASGLAAHEVLEMLQSPQSPPTKVILTSLIAQFENLPDQVVIVLDDYHLITAQAVHQVIMFMLDHLPAALRLVITSREDPPLPLARMRAGDHLVEIRADDLRFTAAEIGQFLEKNLGTLLSDEQLNDMDTRTEGWIAGLQLAALAMKGREDLPAFISAFTGSHRYILDYLTEEVLGRQSEEVTNFLLQTSILQRLCAPLCNAVTGRTDSQIILEQIEHSNLFLISLDDDRYWYRYHHLFGEMLLRRLHHIGSSSLKELHYRASFWLEHNGWIGEAVKHAISSGDTERVVELIETYGDRVWMSGDATTVLQWLSSLPETVIQQRPKLGMTYAFMLTAVDRFVEAEQCLVSVEHALANYVDENSDEYTSLSGQAATIRATVAIQLGYDVNLALAAGEQALAQLPDSLVRWRAWVTMIVGNSHFSIDSDLRNTMALLEEAIRLGEQADDMFTMLVALAYLTQVHLIQGKLNRIQNTSAQLLKQASKSGWKGLPAIGVARMSRAWVRYEHNDLDGAYQDIVEGHKAAQGYELKRVSLPSYVLLSRIKQVQGDATAAHELMQHAVTMMRTDNLIPASIGVYPWMAWLSLVQGDLESASQWGHEFELSLSTTIDPAFDFECITLARIWSEQGRYDEAQDLLGRLLLSVSEAGRMGRVVTIRVLQALIYRLQGNIDSALEALTHALSLGEAEGYLRTFVDEGAPMAALLRDAKMRGIAVEYVTHLLAAFDGKTQLVTMPHEHAASDDIEPLSERELEVLNLIADGASNREIADALVVSIGTVKKHLNNIFLKLDAHSRTQVVANARKYNIL